jgi:Mg2+-importing ATPase
MADAKITPAPKPAASFDMDWARLEAGDLLQRLGSRLEGLSEAEARAARERHGFNEQSKPGQAAAAWQLLRKFFEPLVVVLLVISGFSWFYGEPTEAVLVFAMAVLSVALSFVQEYRAGQEAQKLSEMVSTKATVLRGGKTKELPIRELVPGDIVDLYAGDMIPADLRLLSGKDLFINQAALTGESYPVEKEPGVAGPQASAPQELRAIALMGTSVVSGTAMAVVLATGPRTQFGAIAQRLTAAGRETTFDKGIRQFTWLMIRLMLILSASILGIQLFVEHASFSDALLFALSVAVGLTPEMLPMIVAVNLSKGSSAMAKHQVIVKRLASIQNFGAMDVLCTDKTGTLTMDKVVLEKHCDVVRQDSDEVLKLAFLNSFFQTGLKNLLDRAILKHESHRPATGISKVDEIPFDFQRRIMSVVVDEGGKHTLIAKGAPEELFKRCARYQVEDEVNEIDPLLLDTLKQEFNALSAQGYRVLALAYKSFDQAKAAYGKDDEAGLTLAGYVAFLDPPKPTTRKTIQLLERLGIELKVLTGDNDLVTRKICSEVGLNVKGMVVGDQLEAMDDAALRELVRTTTVFARLSPLQKERVVHALHANGHTVGFLGDGINDAPALKAADIGISVNNAVDIAKESADLILLRKSLLVLREGVIEGRRTFANIIKYIRMGASSNFGNMFSMTGASLLIPFLPMQPIQILLNNFLYDLSQVGIPTDNVDPENLKSPRAWDIAGIQRYVVTIGPLSSIFDFATFGILWWGFKGALNQPLFNTGWFMESLLTQTLVIFVIRTSKQPFIESMPSRFLMLTSGAILAFGLALPYTPLAATFKLVPPPASFLLVLEGVIFCYLFLVQSVKTWVLKKLGGV